MIIAVGPPSKNLIAKKLLGSVQKHSQYSQQAVQENTDKERAQSPGIVGTKAATGPSNTTRSDGNVTSQLGDSDLQVEQ
jgi:FlaG/FlaF family flagellin (archaellin)